MNTRELAMQAVWGTGSGTRDRRGLRDYPLCGAMKQPGTHIDSIFAFNLDVRSSPTALRSPPFLVSGRSLLYWLSFLGSWTLISHIGKAFLGQRALQAIRHKNVSGAVLKAMVCVSEVALWGGASRNVLSQ